MLTVDSGKYVILTQTGYWCAVKVPEGAGGGGQIEFRKRKDPAAVKLMALKMGPILLPVLLAKCFTFYFLSHSFSSPVFHAKEYFARFMVHLSMCTLHVHTGRAHSLLAWSSTAVVIVGKSTSTSHFKAL